MDEVLLKSTIHDATSSWYGYEVQGKIGMLYFLEKLNNINTLDNCNLFIEFEQLEDFSIGIQKSISDIEYVDLYQVKSKLELSNKDLIKVYKDLGMKKIFLDSSTNIYLINRFPVEKEYNEKKILDEHIEICLKELDILKNYNDIGTIRRNLNTKNTESELKNIRNIFLELFGSIKNIKDAKEINMYCDKYLEKFSNYKKMDKKIQINIIIEDFEQISENLPKKVKSIMRKIGINEEYKNEDEYVNKVVKALLYFVSTSLENYVLTKSQPTFKIYAKEIIDIIKKDQTIIDELQWLFYIRETIKKDFGRYCEYCERSHNEIDFPCGSCELKSIIEEIISLKGNEFKKLIKNTNPHLIGEKIDFGTASGVLGDSKLENYIFDEIKSKKYIINNINNNQYIRSYDNNHMFSFIDMSNKDLLKRRLEEKFIYNINVYNDNEVILNKNLDFEYTAGESLSINQHWDKDYLENEKNKILSSRVDFKSINGGII